MPSFAVQNALDSVAAISGITQSYVDFTTKLVTDVMNALVASSISQMRAYTNLVSQLEQGLAAYKSVVNTPQTIIQWLESRIPEFGTNPSTLTAPAALSQNSANIIRDLYLSQLPSILGAPSKVGAIAYVLPSYTDVADGQPVDMTNTNSVNPARNLVGSTLSKGSSTSDILNLTGIGATDYTNITNPIPTVTAAINDNTLKVIVIDLLSAVLTMLNNDAANSYQQLDLLVRTGFTRIIIPDGHLLTRMSFKMNTADASQANSQDIYGSSFAVSGSAGASWGWGSASIKASYSNFSVHLADEHSQTSTDIQVAMMGEVLINFKSDYFPQLPSQAKS